MSKKTVVALIVIVFLGFLFFTLSQADETPILPDYTKAPYSEVPDVSGVQRRPFLNPEFGDMTITVYGNGENGDGIAIFKNKNGNVVCAEWVTDMPGDSTKWRIHSFLWDDASDAFVFDKSVDVQIPSAPRGL